MYLLIKHESIIYDHTIKKMLNYVNCMSRNDRADKIGAADDC